MAQSESERVPRTPEELTPEQALDKMSVCESYTISELEETFEDA